MTSGRSMFLNSAWRSKTGSTGKFTVEVYYDLLWNATYQHDLNNAAGQKKRQAFISNKLIHLMNLTMILEKTPHLIKMRMILPQSQSFNLLSFLLNLKKLPRCLSLTNFGESFLRLQRSLSLNTTRRLRLLTSNHMVATLNLNLHWVNPIQSPQVHFHENDHPCENPPSEDSTQAMVQ